MADTGSTCGRPLAFSASGPPAAYFSRHVYSNFRWIPSSSASTTMFAVSSIRSSTASLNARVKRHRRFLDTLVLLPEQCVWFSCLIFGGHSNTDGAKRSERDLIEAGLN